MTLLDSKVISSLDVSLSDKDSVGSGLVFVPSIAEKRG